MKNLLLYLKNHKYPIINIVFNIFLVIAIITEILPYIKYSNLPYVSYGICIITSASLLLLSFNIVQLFTGKNYDTTIYSIMLLAIVSIIAHDIKTSLDMLNSMSYINSKLPLISNYVK